MAIIKVGFRSGEKTKGTSPSGRKLYLVGSDTPIADDIDQILDATGIPAYKQLWDASDAMQLRVATKRAVAIDDEENTQEGYWWHVECNYELMLSGQSEEDPTDRDWLWAKASEKYERNIPTSLFDTSGYVYPDSTSSFMINLDLGEVVANTAGEIPENGVSGQTSLRVITLKKYVNDASDLGVASWSELDTYIDTINDGTVMLLDILYEKWQLLIDDIGYGPYAENGFECFEVDIRIIADTFKSHVFTFVNAGFNEYKYVDGAYKLVKITLPEGDDPTNPQLLDLYGEMIPLPTAPPFINQHPYLISVGRNKQKDWSGLTIPSSIP